MRNNRGGGGIINEEERREQRRTAARGHEGTSREELCKRGIVMGEAKRGGRDKGWVRGRVGGPQGLLALIGPQALGHAATTSKVRYTSSTAGKCRPKWERAAGHKEEERKRGRGRW